MTLAPNARAIHPRRQRAQSHLEVEDAFHVRSRAVSPELCHRRMLLPRDVHLHILCGSHTRCSSRRWSILYTHVTSGTNEDISYHHIIIIIIIILIIIILIAAFSSYLALIHHVQKED